MKKILEIQKGYNGENFGGIVQEEGEENENTEKIQEITIGAIEEVIQQLKNMKAIGEDDGND